MALVFENFCAPERYLVRLLIPGVKRRIMDHINENEELHESLVNLISCISMDEPGDNCEGQTEELSSSEKPFSRAVNTGYLRPNSNDDLPLQKYQRQGM